MTRDQAIRLMSIAMSNPQAEYMDETVARVTPIVDGLIALGILHVDESAASMMLIKCVCGWNGSESRLLRPPGTGLAGCPACYQPIPRHSKNSEVFKSGENRRINARQ